MDKIYKIFYNEKLIILTNRLTSKLLKNKIFLLEDISIKEFISKIEHKKLKKVVIFYPENDIFEKFLQKIERIQAGGGVVQNKVGDILFIKRKGKWDLPKGKLEKGEKLSTVKSERKTSSPQKKNKKAKIENEAKVKEKIDKKGIVFRRTVTIEDEQE